MKRVITVVLGVLGAIMVFVGCSNPANDIREGDPSVVTGTGTPSLTVQVTGLTTLSGKLIAVTLQQGYSIKIKAGSVSDTGTYTENFPSLSAGSVTVMVEVDTNGNYDTTETGDKKATKTVQVVGGTTLNLKAADFTTNP